jgi:ElaB/YqjD/DUF883 family membrane-anchored ribosome-binding protein
MAMTITTKSQLAPEKGSEPHSVSAFYGANGPVGELMEHVEDEVHTLRDESGRFTAHRDTPFGDRVADTIDRAATSVQKAAKKTAASAQSGARSTAQAVREHPGMTAAILGGIATAAYAGVRIYKASKEDHGVADATIVAPKRRVASASRTVSKRKH